MKSGIKALGVIDQQGADAIKTGIWEAGKFASLPMVAAASGTTETPGDGYVMTFSFEIEGRTALNASGREDAEQLRAVLPGYFATLRVPLRAGRAFSGGAR